MKVVQISNNDVISSRFNGFTARPFLAEQGIESTHIVWDPKSADPAVVRAFDYPGSRALNRFIGRVETRLSLHSVLQPHSFLLPLHRAFRKADVVHYHIIHDGYFSIFALPFLTWLKPSVWTWHDPWPMTGHCVYPMECSRWQIGCGACPDLGREFAMRRDHTAFAFKQKQWVNRHLRNDIVVASQYMMDMARRSPIAQHARIHCIPFGLDLTRFRPRDPDPARRRFGVFKDNVVIGIRAHPSHYKGLEYFIAAMDRTTFDRPVTILTTHIKGELNQFIGKHQIIDLGWVDDEDLLVDAYAATDFFVVPSTAEAFGMMAIEAMACGKPVIIFDGTSLPEVTFAPEVGIAVPMRDVDALAAAMRRLVADRTERQIRGVRGRAKVEQYYDIRLHTKRIANLYWSIARQRTVDKVT